MDSAPRGDDRQAPAPGAPPRPSGSGLPPGMLRDTLALAAVLACFFSPALLGRGQFLFRDSGRMHVPVKTYVAEELRRGHLPQWNPYSGLGSPLVSGAVDAVQHPFNLLLLALPFDLGFKLWIVLCYLVAATGVWLWARRLGCGRLGAFTAGLAFALSGHLVSSSDNVTYLSGMAPVPWILAAAHDWIERGGAGRLALLGAASALSAAGGDPQGWGFAIALLPVYAALFLGSALGARAAAVRGVIAAGAAAVAAAPFILPVVAWIPHSSRANPIGAVEYLRWNLHPLRLLELVLPHLTRSARGALEADVFRTYAGDALNVAPWVLSVYAGVSVVGLAVFGAVRARSARILVLGAAVATWMAMGAYAGFGALARHVPVLASFRYWEKLVVWPSLLLAVAAGFGIERLALGGSPAARFGAITAGVGGLSLALGAAASAAREELARLVQRAPDSAAAAVQLAENLAEGLLASGALCVLLGLVALARGRGRMPRLAGPLLLLVVALDLGAANVRAYVLSPPEIAHAPSPFAEFLKARPGLQRVVAPYAALAGRRPDLTSMEEVWLWFSKGLAPAWNVGHRIGNFEAYTGMPPVRTDVHRQRVKAIAPLGLFAVGYMVVPGGPAEVRASQPPEPYHVAAVDPSLPASLVAFPHRPRAYLAAEVVPVDRRTALQFAVDPASARTERTVLEGPVPPDATRPEGEATIVEDHPERLAVETRSDRRALLVLNDQYAEGWRASVDGRRAEILPANYLARGVWVEAGTHRVEFTYRTPMLAEGWAIAAVAAASLGLAAARRGWRA